jgi:hypothetical protein
MTRPPPRRWRASEIIRALPSRDPHANHFRAVRRSVPFRRRRSPGATRGRAVKGRPGETRERFARAPAGVTRVTSVEGITEYRLANGLKFLLFPDPSKPTITVNITYLVGSRHENYGETGMAHLLEHLMFKGSQKHPKLDEEFNRRGARSNATTALDRTNYFELFQATDDNLEWAIEMEADRMTHAKIAKKDLDSEMTVVRNEFEQGENSPFSVLLKRLQSISYDWHSYGRSTIGNRSDIENVKIENLQAFYRMYYQPTTPCSSSRASSTRRRRCGWWRSTSGRSRSRSARFPPLWTGGAHAGRHARIHRAPQGRYPDRRHRVQGALEPARRFGPDRLREQRACRTRRRGASTRRSSRPARRRRSSAIR